MIAAWLFKNVNRRQVILKNTFWLTAAVGLSGLGDFLLTVYVIRKFGPVRYGTYGYALSFVSLFSSLFDFGLATAATREFAADSTRERHFGNLITLKLLIGAVGIAAVWIGGFLITVDPFTRWMILVLSFYIALVEMANVFYALFRARQKMEIEAGCRFFYIACLAAFVLGFTSLRPSVLSVAAAYLGAVTLTVGAATGFVLRIGGLGREFRLSVNVPVWREFLGIGLYIALVRATGDVTVNIGSVLLGHLGRLADIGWYNAAAKIYGLMLFPMSLVASAIFPALAEARASAPDRFVRYWRTWAQATLVLSVLLSVLVLGRAGDIVELLYHGNFQPAVRALQILVVAGQLVYLQNIYYHALLVANRQRDIFFAGVVAAAANVSLNVILVPHFGLYGVATGMVVTQLLLFAQYLMLTWRHAILKPVFPELWWSALACIISGATLYAFLTVMPHGRIGFALAVPLGVLVYLVMMKGFMELWRRACPL
ncbi:MAG TPA: flippase [bacterium]|nr:flippase [bacterium]